MSEVSAEERLDRLRLCRTESIGPITFHAFLRRFGSARAALEALPRLKRRGERAPFVTALPREEAERELSSLARAGGRLICWGEASYPPALAEIEDAPPVLSLFGELSLLQRPMVAIVGARNASAQGCRIARTLASELSAAGVAVVSGLARGIDSAAHWGALEGGTAAVQAGGVDIVYPQENRALYEAIRKGGAVAAELSFGTQPQARHFPRRNRIISGMALGVVVIEAAAHSGSLITARYALEQGREVFAVPGSPLDPRSRGANDLLRKGAGLVEKADDVLDALAPFGERKRPPRQEGALTEGPPVAPPAPAAAEGAVALILELLGPSPVAVDELVRQSGMSASFVASLLLELELSGKAERHPGNLVSLR